MKRLILICALAVVPSCAAAKEFFGKPADPAQPDGPTVGQEIGDGVASTVTTVATATGNPVIIAAAGVLSILLAGGAATMLSTKKKPPTA